MELKVALKLNKEYFWECLGTFYNLEELNYDKLTRKVMANMIISYYKNNPNMIYEILNDKEIDYLARLVNSDEDNELTHFISLTFLSILNEVTFKYEILDDLNELIEDRIKYYYENKEEIEKEKEIIYLAKGLFVAYGALTKKEFNQLISKYTNKNSEKLLNHPYLKRYIEKDNKNNYALKQISNTIYVKEILDTHAKEFKTIYDKEVLLSYGKYGFNVLNKNYLKIKDEEIFEIIEENLSLLAVYAGLKLIVEGMEKIEYALDSCSDELRLSVRCFLCDLPYFLLNDNDNSRATKEETEVFYNVFHKLLIFGANYYNMKLEYGYIDGNFTINQEDSYHILEKMSKQRFKIVNDFILKEDLNDDEKEFAKGLKKAIFGTFIVYKHTKNGSIFVSENNKYYLVKGLISKIDSMLPYNIPFGIVTAIVPLHDKIVCCGICNYIPVSLGPGIKKQLDILYKENIDNIITKL